MKHQITLNLDLRAIIVLSAGLILLAVAVAAAGTRLPAVMAVDVDRIRMDSKSVQAEIARVSGPAKEIQDQLRVAESRLNRSIEEYKAQEKASTEAANSQRRAEIEKHRVEVERLANDFNRRMNSAEIEGLAPIRERIMKNIEAVARERGVEIVVSMQAVVFRAEQTDLTDAVIARLDAGGTAQ